MFAKLFQNAFIITKSSMNNYISMNYDVSNKLIQETEVIQFLEKLSKISEKTNKNSYPVFYIVDDYMFNPIMQQYCYYMGLDYKAYQIIIEYALFYEEVFIRPYNPTLNNKFTPISVRKFSIVGQSIPWNYGIIPFEYWVNHKKDPYFKKVFDKIISDSVNYNIYEYMCREQIINPIYCDYRFTDLSSIEDGKLDFINSRYTNYKWNNEFDMILYNKRLENYLEKTNFILRNIEIDDDVKKRIEEEKNKKIERHECYDNFSIYKNFPYDRSEFYK